LFSLMRQRRVGGEVGGPFARQVPRRRPVHLYGRHLDGRGSQIDAEHQAHGLHVLGEATRHPLGRLQGTFDIFVGMREGHE